jgi:hypothetical protein
MSFCCLKKKNVVKHMQLGTYLYHTLFGIGQDRDDINKFCERKENINEILY